MRVHLKLVALALIIPAFANAAWIEKRQNPPHPAIVEFQDFIESNPEIRTGFTNMFLQIPNTTEYKYDPTGLQLQVRDYPTMLSRMNDILTTAPKFGDSAIPFPIHTIVFWPMCTEAGLTMFRNDKVNEHLRNILKTWATFLSTGDSRSTLNNGTYGWLSEKAVGPNLCDMFVCDPKQEYYGFKSWDDFFTRELRPHARPIDAPTDTSVVVQGCESTPFRIRRGVKESDTFWVKGEPYSLRDMLHNDPRASQFANGTIYQGWLAGRNYHRWHSPVNGTIVSVESVDGTYYAISPTLGFNATEHPDPVGDGISQAFMTNVATRTIFFIEADNKDIGLMAYVTVGMVEVSSCTPTVKAGDRVNKGDQLGMFHYGGSSYVMVFRPETQIEFTKEVEDAVNSGGPVVPLNRKIGVVTSTNG
ncbi:hypothetical protein D9756_001112 [Leucocoprinus leucothites]|uniref:L-tryptophan decarboxylase PsiD-like domain-containing protein n=1 Tax=Leucocoprinus leucothites TaxID=201217 RepID=A0A8H5GGJ4_9AGAR|nr:hypothetical protein D9756_001112 [Leucoagaricus leucothites]